MRTISERGLKMVDSFKYSFFPHMIIMGLLVPSLVLNGISMCNVYVSISQDVSYVRFNPSNDEMTIGGTYSISKDRTIGSPSLIQIPYSFTSNNHTGTGELIYLKLKSIYPDAVDIREDKYQLLTETETEPEVDTSQLLTETEPEAEADI
jgi:hypothetical protein